MVIWLKSKSGRGGKFLGWILLNIGKFTIFPFILFGYKIILRIKIKIKNSKLKNINYIHFIKKYLPGIGVSLILLIVTTNTIFAQSYDNDEYASHTLLSTLITADEEYWSELIEEEGPAVNQPKIVNYLEEQGNIQELVINNPNVDETYADGTGVSTDSGSLVILNPEDTGIDSGDTPTGRTEAITYVVQPGDVLGNIAEKYNVSVNTILWENNLSWNSTIRPGQKLSILPQSGINYEIKSGDTVLAIAKKYQTEASDIVEINKLADAGDIAIGDTLFIPNGVKPTQVVSSYKPPTPVYSNDDDIPANAEDINTGTKFLWPTISKRITQYYNWSHTGLDIGDKTGNPIYAAEAGKVEKAGWNSGGYGNYVIINHGNGLKTLYGHASKLLVSVGDSVSRGETIALIGSTGRSTGPHLHFEVRVDNARKNPLNYIK